MKKSTAILLKIASKVLFLLSILITHTLGWAETADRETVTIAVGGSISQFNSVITVNGKTRENNTSVDVEDDLGQDEDVDFVSIKGIWRFANRHRLSLEYSPFSRSSRTTLDDDFSFDDNTIQLDSEIRTESDFYVYDINYIYSVYQSDRLEIGLSAGVYWLDYEFEVRASGFIEDENGNVEFDDSFKDNVSTDIPLPLFGVYFDYQLSENWRTLISGRYFDASIDDYQGDITSLVLAFDYNVWKDLSVGFSISRFDLNANADSDEFDGHLGWEYSGAQLYLIGRF